MLNKIPILDKGHVAFVSASLNGKEMRNIEDLHFDGKINRELWNAASLTLHIRCPIFVQIFFQQARLDVINTIEKEVECYIPDISEINTGDHSIDKEIAEHMKQTVEALLLTSKAFEQDGLSRFTASSLMPVSVYNTIIVSGSLDKWINLLKKKTPKPISLYIDTIYDIVSSEWDEIDLFMGKRDGKKKEATKTTK